MKKEIKNGFISISDFNNFEEIAKEGYGIEVFADIETAKDVYPKRTRIRKCRLILIEEDLKVGNNK